MNRAHSILLLLLPPAWLLAGGCERCSERQESVAPPVDPAAGLPTPVEPRAESAPLPWESVDLGADRDRFAAALADLTGMSAADLAGRLECAPRTTLEMIEPGGDSMVERTPAGRFLEGCALLRPGGGAPSLPVSIRGDFIDGRLASVAFFFPLEREAALLAGMEGRFGKADRRAMKLQTIFGVEQRAAHVWNVEDKAWLLLPGEHAVTLVRQDPRAAADLGRPKPVPVRGERISLDDIGLGNGLDLDSPPVPFDLDALRALLDEADAGE